MRERWIIIDMEVIQSEIMRRIKGQSSRKLFKIFPELKKRYWGQDFWEIGNIRRSDRRDDKELHRASF